MIYQNYWMRYKYYEYYPHKIMVCIGNEKIGNIGVIKEGGSPPVGYRLPYGTLYDTTNMTCTLNITLSGQLPVYLLYTDINEESVQTTLSLGLNTFSIKPYSWFVLFYPDDAGKSNWISNLTVSPNTSHIGRYDSIYTSSACLPLGNLVGFGTSGTSTIFIHYDDQYGGDVSCLPSSSTISMNLHTSSADCFLKGTKITLADGTYKNCEDIIFDDDLLVWDFYKGEFASAKPILIQKPLKSTRYNKLTFSDGTVVGYVGHKAYHRIFNQQAGAFTGTASDETPVNTTTFKDDRTTPYLVSKEMVDEDVEYYNIITDRHYNCFTNGILASCRLSNQYHIENMKYVGDKLFDNNYVKEYLENVSQKDYWLSNK